MYWSLAVLGRNKPLFFQVSETLGYHTVAWQILTDTPAKWQKALHSLMRLHAEGAPLLPFSLQSSNVPNAWCVGSLWNRPQRGLFHRLVDSGEMRKPGPRRHRGLQTETPTCITDTISRNWGLPWTMRLEVIKTTLV